MAIFISHTTADDSTALGISRYLKRNYNIDSYLDDMDKSLSRLRGTASITSFLIDNLRKCDTLLAVISSNTKSSWWVPFEIGSARQMPRRIASYTDMTEYSLPEYLLEWPRLRNSENLDTFAREYVSHKRLNGISASVNFSQEHLTESTVRNFETTLMKSLGQRSYR